MASVLREGVFQVVRRAGGALPLPVLAALLYPAAFVRALFETLARRSPRPPMSLPPDELGASFGVVLRARTSAWMNTAALLWADRFDRSPWRQRFELSDLEQLRTLIATRPVLVTTVHFGGIFVMPTLLRALGIPTAAVVGDKLWPVRWWRERRAQLTAVAGLPAHLRSGDARQIVRYLRPGRALLVALDYPLGDQVLAGYDGRALRLSTPSIRLARITGAVVVPAILRVDGLWRYSLHVGRPVPDSVLSSGNDSTVVALLVNELLPVAAARPEQALPLLVSSFVDAPR